MKRQWKDIDTYMYIYIHISTKTLKDSLMANGAVGGAGLLILETEAS